MNRAVSLMLVGLAFGSLDAETVSEPSIVRGEIIVKFSNDHTIDPAISDAFADPRKTADLEAYVEQLASQMAAPLRFSRLTSGREIVVEIRREQLLSELADRVAHADRVADVEIQTHDAGLTDISELVVDFKPCNKPNLGNQASVDTTARTLLGDVPHEFRAHTRADKRLGIDIDFRDLLTDLVAALNARNDVDYAQPSYVLRHRDDDG